LTLLSHLDCRRAAHAAAHFATHLIEQIVSTEGEVIYTTPTGSRDQVFDPHVAWLITDILSDNDARTPGFGPHSVLQIGRPAAVKTFERRWIKE